MNILPTEQASLICNQMMNEFDSSSDFFSLCQKGKGKHFGALVCTDGTVYKAFSGQLFGSYFHEGYVPPCFEDVEKYLNSSSSEFLHSMYRFYCFDGKTTLLPKNSPTGTGDCCEPKLLSYCYSQGKKPLSMACFFYGDGSYPHKAFTQPCEARCKKLLPLIIGLDIVYLDSSVVVVNKPSGLLSIEGKGLEKQDSVAHRVKTLFSSCIAQPCVHRLDQATSGLMVLGLTDEAHRTLSMAFEKRLVKKEYVALVHGEFPLTLDGYKGTWEIKQRLDIDNRPMQIVDNQLGKTAVTYWQRLGTVRLNGSVFTKLLLCPQTGRTHQLRLACSHFGHPIAGDSLYGISDGFNKLQLCARHLEFDHPKTGKHLVFEVSDSLEA